MQTVKITVIKTARIIKDAFDCLSRGIRASFNFICALADVTASDAWGAWAYEK